MPTETKALQPLPPPTVPMFLPGGAMSREWYQWYQSADELLRAIRGEVSDLLDPVDGLLLTDGVTAPAAVSGRAQIYVDTADGDLKVRFGDNVTKTLATDT